MLVVYNDALEGDEVLDDLNAWADWKRRLGFEVALLGLDVTANQDDLKAPFALITKTSSMVRWSFW
jgi:hypothetical protein